MFYTSCSHTAKKYFSVITNKLWTLILQAWVIPQPPQCSPDDRKQNTVHSVKETLIWHNCLSDVQMMMLCSLQLLQLKSTTTTNTPIIIIINFTSSNKTVRRNNKWSKNFYHAMLCIHGTSHGPVSMSVCPSVTSRCSIETAERIELVFGMWASFHPSYTVLKRNSVISKKYGHFPLKLCPKVRTWKISPRHIDRRNVLST